MEIRFISSKQIRASADAELPLPVARASDLSGRVLGARYSLRRRIGGGSLGTVYEARDMTLGTAVAVKILHPEYSGDEDFRRRFHQEALLGARLRHEHSVAVTDLGQSDDGLLYSVMEYLEGESLDGLLSSSQRPLPWRRVVTIAVQVCAALQAAHDRGVIHRDIKPGNCFLVRREGRSERDEHVVDDEPPFTFVKVLDLGLARLMPSSGRPTPPGRLGAPEYLAPEQVQGFTCDHRVDVYALGVMMYKLLTRRLPFTGESPAAIMKMHIESVPAPLRRVAPSAEIPASLEAVVLRALAKAPGDRFPSAHAMAQAIRAAAADAEAEAIAIDETFDDAPTGLWRAGASAVGPRLPHIPLIAPGLGYIPSVRHGLVGLLLALVSILVVALVTLASGERPEHRPGTLTVAAPVPPAPQALTPGPPLPAPGPRTRTPALPTSPTPAATSPGARPDDLVGAPQLAQGTAVPPAPQLTVDADGPAVKSGSPRAARPRAPRRLSEETAPAPDLDESPRTPGAPSERVFQRLADTVAPGVYACMDRHTPGLTTLTLEMTVGGPRRTPVELRVVEYDDPDLRKCLAAILSRLNFPATERTARYAHVYRP